MKNTALHPNDGKLALAHIAVGYIALFLGAIAGLLQAFVRSGTLELPAGIGYYQLLTAHGVLLALVFTTFFIIGFLYASMSRTTGDLTPFAKKSAWIGFWLMTIGTAITTVMILLNKATVLYTFYAPLKASPWFYIGLTLVVVGSWVSGAGMFSQYAVWKKKNEGKPSPLLSFMAVATMILWIIATLGVAVTVLFQFIPWSFGLVDKINVLLSRTLFWYFGHPLVYFWLLPAYMCWYVIIPKIIGGKIFSDSLARLAFVLFVLFSIPVGFHHQILESGITPFWKFLQIVLTFMVIVPSLMTAFALFATFEISGREKGASGLFGWVKKLPWTDVRFFAPFMGMLVFIPGGAGGIINASNQMNQVVHNTLWVTGHFHLTVATTVALTFFGISYWLVPHLTGRTLTPRLNKLGIIQTVFWCIGMFLMSGAMHTVGLFGAPRRTAYTTYGDHPQALEWMSYQTIMAVGGAILFVAILMILYIVINLAVAAPKGTEEFPVGEVHEDAEKTPLLLENWKIWIGLSVVLIVIAYTVPVIDIIENAPSSPGFKFW
ncbi:MULTISPECIES: b(o/a)3-type cytochrome-c oxidase subunit 1 [Aeribacillus]|jgi:cytochrome c oxidase subunit I|uniref:Cytochrome C n=1 Tax=Aeribacillus pallidus TaxID=33936 RepID=A0A165WTA7_9BACI|nr:MULTISPECIES: b(o/a)3-type cytochrome-c oxidase subunit 1 [Aeribacillus]KZM53342.1 cytochrome C [Aeribacillus pallidus]KZN95296.1 cytochrome C [Aeribacillus pallidus]MED0649357.1 b(o/a)3-type cytochrome-c oxidase subunit 1 [Aeribacillus composti]MED0702705.1 b(o/a)3-type cytochrome-c oxidase subunit 1 [Aeribacillus composti]MED0716720.1 b(o/a)3-type cytochrome-c oxidase subunit 1 [Aeribacillus composti]